MKTDLSRRVVVNELQKYAKNSQIKLFLLTME